MSVSDNYIKLASEEEVRVMSRVYSKAWQSPAMPDAQYEAVVKGELEAFKRGKSVRPYEALGTMLQRIPWLNAETTRLLDVGASSGYYREVLSVLKFKCDYTALDFSPYYKDLALTLFPGIQFEVGSADELPFESKSFAIVLSGACIMHLPLTYEKAIAEAARVASDYVILHRTPIYKDDTPTEFFVKTAYGTPCVEGHFNEAHLLDIFERTGLKVEAETDVFMDGNFGHRTYLLKVQ